MNTQEHHCIFCDAGFVFDDDIVLEAVEGCTTDCPKCGRTMLIEGGKLLDLHKILNEEYVRKIVDEIVV